MNELEQLERRTRLWHVENAAVSILSSVSKRTLDEFTSDDDFRDAIERRLIVIGEAISRAVDVDSSLKDRITDVDGIIGLRNQLIHNYPRVNRAIVWEIIEQDLPLLLTEVRALLAEP